MWCAFSGKVAWLEASRNRLCQGAETGAVARAPMPTWTSHNRLRRRCECALIPALQLVVWPPGQSPTKGRTHQGQPIAAHQAPASIGRWIKSDGGDLVFDPNFKFTYSAPVWAYRHRKTPPSNIRKLRVLERAKDRGWSNVSYPPRHQRCRRRQCRLQHSGFVQDSQNKSDQSAIFCFKSLTHLYVALIYINIDQET